MGPSAFPRDWLHRVTPHSPPLGNHVLVCCVVGVVMRVIRKRRHLCWCGASHQVRHRLIEGLIIDHQQGSSSTTGRLLTLVDL